MKIGSLVGGVIATVLGALMLAEGVLTYIADLSIFFAGTNPSFIAAVGIVTIVLASSLLEEGRK